MDIVDELKRFQKEIKKDIKLYKKILSGKAKGYDPNDTFFMNEIQKQLDEKIENYNYNKKTIKELREIKKRKCLESLQNFLDLAKIIIVRK